MKESRSSAPPAGGRLERRKIATRSGLVRAGRKLFSEKGLYEARIEDLAEVAGIAKGTLYLYFSRREELVQAVVEEGFDELGRRVFAAASGQQTLPGLVDRVVQAHLDFFADNPDLLRVFHQVRGILKFHRPEWLPLREPLERHIRRLTRLLAMVPSTVRERSGERRAIALVLFGAVSGACSVRAALGAGPAPERWSILLRRGFSRSVSGLSRRPHAARRVRRRS